MSEIEAPNGGDPDDPFNAEWIALGRLSNAVRDALKKLEEDRKANEKRIEASVHKMRWFRRAGVIGVVAGVIGIIIGGFGLYEVNKIYDQRAKSRVVSCQSDNSTATRVNALNDRDQNLLRTVVKTGSRTPEQQAATEKFVNNELAEYQKIKVPLRDCSPAAVNKFYQGQ